MKHYFHRFATEADFNTEYNGSDYEEPWVSAINNASARTSEDFAPSYNKGEDGVNITQQPLDNG